MIELISSLKVTKPSEVQLSIYVEPSYGADSDAMVFQLGMMGRDAVATAEFFFYSPSQVDWGFKASCGEKTLFSFFFVII